MLLCVVAPAGQHLLPMQKALARQPLLRPRPSQMFLTAVHHPEQCLTPRLSKLQVSFDTVSLALRANEQDR